MFFAGVFSSINLHRSPEAMGANSSVPANYNAASYTLLTLDVVLSILAVTGRTASRKIMKATPAIDDYLCWLAFVSASSASSYLCTNRIGH
jgi:hypothetical protein